MVHTAATLILVVVVVVVVCVCVCLSFFKFILIVAIVGLYWICGLTSLHLNYSIPYSRKPSFCICNIDE